MSQFTISILLAIAFSASFATSVNASAPKSLDEADRLSWGDNVISPLEKEARQMTRIKSRKFGKQKSSDKRIIELSGEWIMMPDLNGKPDETTRIPARVPGSVHSALFEAGIISDPMIGMNDSIALKNSYKGWWLTKNFEFQPDSDPGRWILDFEGIANYCTVFLNGQEIGRHEGMFGGPHIDVTDLLRKGVNQLTVKLEPVPNIATGMTGLDRDSWRNTVVINCVYGWHYAKIMPLGIWQPVSIRHEGNAVIENPFIATRDTTGNMLLAASLKGVSEGSVLRLNVAPVDRDKEVYSYMATVNSPADSLFSFSIPNPRLWWPNDMGPQNLYRAELMLETPAGTDRKDLTFGIRTIEMAPMPCGEQPDRYNWVMKINGEEMFVKGTNWCSVDAILRFDSPRYERLLKGAKQQHLQLLRAWGGGAPETERFYQLCDSLGLMVFQEWPTAWNSHNDQPYVVLEETVRLNTLRLRNHPSLVMWGGGNESTEPFGKAIDMMGRYSVELDGTRPFHRGEPWGGSRHDYGCWWGNQHLNHNLNMTADYWGEYGIPSLPDRETVDRYLDGERYSFPVAHDSRFNHHMPVFGNVGEMQKAEQLCRYFASPDSLDNFILAGQLAQVVGGCSVIERSRSRRPDCAGVWYYKLNDVYPAMSWSSIDYYGIPKPYHYFLRRSMAPLAPIILFDRTNLSAQTVSLPRFVVDDFRTFDGDTLTVTATVYNYHFHPVHSVTDSIVASGNLMRLPDLDLTGQMTDSDLLLFKTDVLDSRGTLLARNWYFSNYETRQGVLFDFPGHVRCGDKLTAERVKEGILVRNNTGHPAVGVTLRAPGHQHKAWFNDNYLWLDAGEQCLIEAELPDSCAIEVSAWN